MPRDLDLKRRLILAGLTVTEIAGWQTRGSDALNARGSVNHHTAGPRTGVQPSLGICINGRSDLPGPLCNVHGPREESLRVNLVAAGRANHAGLGGFRGLAGNSTVYGLEEEHVGTIAEGLSDLRRDRIARVHAAFAYGRYGPEMVCQHWEWTTRKVDFVKTLLSPDDLRARVAKHLEKMRQAENPQPQPQSDKEYDDMHTPALIVKGKSTPEWWLTDCITKQHIKTTGHADLLRFLGIAKWDDGTAGPLIWADADVASIRTVP